MYKVWMWNAKRYSNGRGVISFWGTRITWWQIPTLSPGRLSSSKIADIHHLGFERLKSWRRRWATFCRDHLTEPVVSFHKVVKQRLLTCHFFDLLMSLAYWIRICYSDSVWRAWRDARYWWRDKTTSYYETQVTPKWKATIPQSYKKLNLIFFI